MPKYEKQTFINKTSDTEGTLLMAEHMDHIEDGIEANAEAINELSSNKADKTEIPTDYATSDHTHSQYLTQQSLANYYTKAEVDNLLSSIVDGNEVAY